MDLDMTARDYAFELLTTQLIRSMGVFAYPRKKVQSRIFRRLVNDPLPLDALRFLLPQQLLRRQSAQLGHP